VNSFKIGFVERNITNIFAQLLPNETFILGFLHAKQSPLPKQYMSVTSAFCDFQKTNHVSNIQIPKKSAESLFLQLMSHQEADLQLSRKSNTNFQRNI
jgi:hypothetical protein